MVTTDVKHVASPRVTSSAMSQAMFQSFVPSNKLFIAANRLTARMLILLMLLILCLIAATALVVQASETPLGESTLTGATGRAVENAPQQHSVATGTPTPPATVHVTAASGLADIPTPPPVVAGSVTYRTSSTTMAGVTINLSGMSSTQTTTDEEGFYSVPIQAAGAHTITPAHSGQVNGISSFDAAYIAQCVTGLRAMSDCPLLAADTSGNNSLSSFDAALISQSVVGLGGPSSRVGSWVFDPVNRAYASITSNVENQNFAAYLVGEVSGNWQPPAVTVAKQAATLALPYQQHLPLIGK